MSKDRQSDWTQATHAIRTGQHRTHEGEHSEALFLTSSFVFDSAAQAAARFAGDEEGNIYSRFTNPTVRNFQERLAAMEGAEACIATSSGMSAILATCMSLLKAGDHIVCSQSVFGTTVSLFSGVLPRFGVEASFVALTNYEAWERAIRPETRVLFLESPSNPLTEVADIRRLAELAHAHDCLLIVDNCFCSPALQQPLSLGADIVIHSATKYLDGQGRCVGGAVLGPEKLMNEDVFGFLRTAGPTMSPFNAWVFLKGLETLNVRMRAHSASALTVARWLEQQPAVRRVHYPGLESHPQHELAARQQKAAGGIVSFELADQASAWQVIDSTEVCSITANLGDAKTTITHPATTTHWKLTPEEKQAAGISPGLLRLSVGLEDVDDLIADLARGLG